MDVLHEHRTHGHINPEPIRRKRYGLSIVDPKSKYVWGVQPPLRSFGTHKNTFCPQTLHSGLDATEYQRKISRIMRRCTAHQNSETVRRLLARLSASAKVGVDLRRALRSIFLTLPLLRSEVTFPVPRGAIHVPPEWHRARVGSVPANEWGRGFRYGFLHDQRKHGSTTL